MKKILIALLAMALVFSLFATVALADPNSSNGNGRSEERKQEQQERKDEIKERIEERKAEREQLKQEFRERMLARQELRTATKEMLQAQRQIVQEYKQQLRELKAQLEGMSEEERAEYSDEVVALMLQIKDAHKQQLEIMRAYKAEIKEIFPGVRVGQYEPTEEEVDDIAEEVLDDI